MGSKIERGSEIAFRIGRAGIGGTYAPFVHLWGMEKDARGFRERAKGAMICLSPAVPGFVIGGITRDFYLAALISAGGLYAEGVVISSIYEFLCPPDKRSLRKKWRSFGRAIYAPNFSRPSRNSRLRLP